VEKAYNMGLKGGREDKQIASSRLDEAYSHQQGRIDTLGQQLFGAS
jgi:hypothetical protein